ncbi:hypothetical protein LTR08_001674 [Meristemomyces frigidus]|nr:hypothetical protein LTR08_001674 [Meristemomyces frigidus]
MDHIAEEFRREIRAHRCLSFDNFTINAAVTPAKGKGRTRMIRNSVGTFLGFDRYVLFLWGESDKEMQVGVDIARTVRVWHMGEWKTVAEFVSLLRPQPDRDSALSSPHGGYSHQSNWWRANGESFRLFDLPAEIRERIYRHALGVRVEPYPTALARRRGRYNTVIKQRNPNSGILRVNRQVHDEASHVLFTHTPFFVEQRGVLRKLFQNVPQFKLIRRLELALSHYDFFKVFGFQFSENVQIIHQRSTQALRQMDLKHLELIIAAPSLTTETPWFDGACQTLIVDWILEAAYPWLRGHPVKISGYAKSRQKLAFEGACLAEEKKLGVWRMQQLAVRSTEGTLEEYDEWTEELLEEEEGGVRLDGEPWTEEVSGVPSTLVEALPPQCECAVPCMMETWDAEA